MAPNMKTAYLVFTTMLFFTGATASAQAESGKIINEERLRDLIKDKLPLGKLEFVERRDDDTLTVYEYFLMQGDTLHKVVVNARHGKIDTVHINVAQGRAALQARQIAYTRAEAAALAKIPGEVIRWKLKKSEGVWFYKIRVATSKGKLKDVFVDRESFEVKHVRKHEETILNP